MTPDNIRKVKDPERRALEAHGFITRGAQAIDEVRQVRDAAVIELRQAGWTQRRIADLLGLTPAAVNKIDRAQGIRSTRTVERER